MKQISLLEKLRYVKRALKTPYHLFYVTQDKQVMVRFEDKKNRRYEFRGSNMYNSVIEAEEYVKQEIEAGALTNPDKIDVTSTKTNENNQNIL